MRAHGSGRRVGRLICSGRRCIGVLALGLVCAAVPATAVDSIYRWTDESGTIHYRQGIESVPPHHRAAAC